jgi:hypothetical protein
MVAGGAAIAIRVARMTGRPPRGWLLLTCSFCTQLAQALFFGLQLFGPASVADFSSHYGSENFPIVIVCPVSIPNCGPSTFSADVTEHNYLFGPRVSVSVGKLRPFGEALFGAGHVNANTGGSDTSFATALGGGLDYRLVRLIAWRFQGDYVQTRFFGTHQNNLRISTGIVIRF